MVIGRLTLLPRPSAFTVKVLEAMSASAGTSRRSCRLTLWSVAGMAAPSRLPAAGSVPRVPGGAPLTHLGEVAGRQPLFFERQQSDGGVIGRTANGRQ